MSKSNKINLNDWYTTEEARQKLSANSGREINSSYPRTLAKNGKITSLDIGSRGKLYLKRDVDAYVFRHSADQRRERIKRNRLHRAQQRCGRGDQPKHTRARP